MAKRENKIPPQVRKDIMKESSLNKEIEKQLKDIKI